MLEWLGLAGSLAIFFGLILTLLRQYSGWPGLEKRFPWKGKMDGQRFLMQRGHFSRWRGASLWNPWSGISSSAHCIVVGTEGIEIREFIAFRPFLNNLFIPWHEIDDIEAGTQIFSNYAKIQFKNGPGQITLFGSSAKAVAMHWKINFIQPACGSTAHAKH
jgi:hypothetical protein